MGCHAQIVKKSIFWAVQALESVGVLTCSFRVARCLLILSPSGGQQLGWVTGPVVNIMRHLSGVIRDAEGATS